jgi:Fe-S-cluster containining protein
MAWHTKRMNMRPAECYLVADEMTGLPTLWMLGDPCPFLIDVKQIQEDGEAQFTGQQWCGIWKERPNDCRTYPVVTNLAAQHAMDEPLVRHIERCPGFENARPDNPKRTVYQYVRDQLGPDRWIELFLYSVGLVRQIRRMGLYWDRAGGNLSEEEVLKLGAMVLYRQPPLQPDPEIDHAAVLELMEAQFTILTKGGEASWNSPFGTDARVPGRPIGFEG